MDSIWISDGAVNDSLNDPQSRFVHAAVGRQGENMKKTQFGLIDITNTDHNRGGLEKLKLAPQTPQGAANGKAGKQQDLDYLAMLSSDIKKDLNKEHDQSLVYEFAQNNNDSGAVFQELCDRIETLTDSRPAFYDRNEEGVYENKFNSRSSEAEQSRDKRDQPKPQTSDIKVVDYDSRAVGNSQKRQVQLNEDQFVQFMREIDRALSKEVGSAVKDGNYKTTIRQTDSHKKYEDADVQNVHTVKPFQTRENRHDNRPDARDS